MIGRTLAGIVLALSVSCKQNAIPAQPPSQIVSQTDLPTITLRDASTFWIMDAQTPSDFFTSTYLERAMIQHIRPILAQKGYNIEQANGTTSNIHYETTYRIFAKPLPSDQHVSLQTIESILDDYYTLNSTRLGIRLFRSQTDARVPANIYVASDLHVAAKTTLKFEHELHDMTIHWEDTFPCHPSGNHSLFVTPHQEPQTTQALYRHVMFSSFAQGTLALATYLRSKGLDEQTATNHALETCEQVIMACYNDWRKRTNQELTLFETTPAPFDTNIKKMHHTWQQTPQVFYKSPAEDF